MKINHTKYIKARLAQMKAGDVIISKAFPKIPRAIANTTLSRIAQQSSDIRRVKRGVYAKVKKTRLGTSDASPTEILAHEIDNDDNKCFGGDYLFNILGLSTQIPKTITVLNNKSSYKIQLGNTIVRYSKIRPTICKNTKELVMLLEVVKNIKKIKDNNMKKTLAWLMYSLKNQNMAKLGQLVDLAMQYPPRVRAILGNLLEKEHKALSQKLKQSLNENSYYRVGNIINYLSNTNAWSLKP